MVFDEFLTELGCKIKYFRNRKKITQAQLSEIVGVEEYYISDIETGKRNITLKTLYNIASALDVKPVKLFSFDD